MLGKKVADFTAPASTYGYINLKRADGPMTDKNLRRALAFAMDRSAIVQNIWAGQGIPGQVFIRPELWVFDPNFKPFPDKPDLDQARAALAKSAHASDRTKASLLYKAVRDGIRYNPYVNMRTPETFRASSVLAAGNGYCVGKAALYAAACRVHDIPARVGFADVHNHLTTEKLRQSMGTDVFTWHGFTEVYVDGAWRKATPTSRNSSGRHPE